MERVAEESSSADSPAEEVRVLTTASPTGVTRLLEEASRGEPAAAGELFERVYEELRRLARDYLRDERDDHTLQPTALVHEAYIRLVGGREIVWQNRAQFFRLAACVMRHILVDHARRRAAGKRGGGHRLLLDEAMNFVEERDVNLVELDDALKLLSTLDEEQSLIVELRFFGGLSIKETASALQVSEMMVSRKWATAKLWLRSRLVEGAGDAG